MNTLRSIPGGDSQSIADVAVSVWLAIDAALSPVIGPRGNAALYRRSLHLARAHYPWLDIAYSGAVQPGDYSALRDALSQQPPSDATQAHEATLQIFQDLLAELIGRSLSQRLLQAVWEPPSSRGTAQDKSP